MLAVARCILFAVGPALFWMWLYYRRDRWDPEPKAKVLKMFVLGMLVAVPVWWIESALAPSPAGWGGGLVFDNFVRVALVEEGCKFLIVWLFAYYQREFDEPMDGIVYAVAVALGFATVENVVYGLMLGENLILYRAFTSTLAHVAFSGIVGYELGRAKFRGPEGRLKVWFAFLLAVVLHGFYDTLLSFAGRGGRWEIVARGGLLLVLPLALGLLAFGVRRADRCSPFRPASPSASP